MILKCSAGGVTLVCLALVVWIVNVVHLVRRQVPNASDTQISFSLGLFFQPRILGWACLFFAFGFVMTWIFVRR
jgi:hypothetical protein